MFLHSFIPYLCAGFCIIDLDELVVCVCTSAAARSMGWWCRICNQGNDSKSLPIPSIWYSGMYCFIGIHLWECYARLKFPWFDMADFEVWTTTDEQGHGCKPWSSGIHSGNAVSVLILCCGLVCIIKHSIVLQCVFVETFRHWSTCILYLTLTINKEDFASQTLLLLFRERFKFQQRMKCICAMKFPTLNFTHVPLFFGQIALLKLN